MDDIPALILAGGLGTRLRGALPDTPKVLAPVLGRPFLAHLLDALDVAGVREVILCTGFKAEQVVKAFGDTYKNLSIRYSHEDSPLGTGGALRKAAALTPRQTVLAMNGDSYVAANLPAFAAWHRQRKWSASLVLTRVADAGRFGTVVSDEKGRIQSFEEKQGKAVPGWINAGIYLLTRELLNELPDGENVSIERDAFPKWIKRGLGGFRVEAPFLDIGTPESLAQAEGFLAAL